MSYTVILSPKSVVHSRRSAECLLFAHHCNVFIHYETHLVFGRFLVSKTGVSTFSCCHSSKMSAYITVIPRKKKWLKYVAILLQSQDIKKILVSILETSWRWIYTVSVFRTFSSVFLRFCFLKKYALFHPHFCKSISALSILLYIDKNFVQKFCVWTIRAIFRNRAVPLYKKFFSENFCPVCDCLVSADMDT